ncbi:peptide deformylase [Streptacidiphilus sp. P02-A3a]|uniref:peptide deformylase n=1 Tax=Streptacidiphilus sp. P02-A3a TaxID=2704468 RepID=UPI0015F8CDB9|nr:peptide deformylase [Streptacidiphilus sp. P02-A3a]QMU67586.1 peptide deformylase [Streptacidiphilus sp. P02-A3a]
MPDHRDRAIDRRVHVQGRPVDSYPERAPEAARGRVLRITVTGEEILRRDCRPAVDFGTVELSQLIDDMFVTMYVAEGAGLAANQVDVDLRLFVFDCLDDDGVRHVGHILNPVVAAPAPGSRSLLDAPEGCLSVPGPHHELPREERAVVTGVDKDGQPLTIEGTGYFARCLLHETDHLNGMVYIDRLSKRDRRAVLQEMEELMPSVLARRRSRAESLPTPTHPAAN